MTLRLLLSAFAILFALGASSLLTVAPGAPLHATLASSDSPAAPWLPPRRDANDTP
ncbi:hypothetical protein [Burkholderia sp. 3C]